MATLFQGVLLTLNKPTPDWSLQNSPWASDIQEAAKSSPAPITFFEGKEDFNQLFSRIEGSPHRPTINHVLGTEGFAYILTEDEACRAAFLTTLATACASHGQFFVSFLLPDEDYADDQFTKHGPLASLGRDSRPAHNNMTHAGLPFDSAIQKILDQIPRICLGPSEKISSFHPPQAANAELSHDAMNPSSVTLHLGQAPKGPEPPAASTKQPNSASYPHVAVAEGLASGSQAPPAQSTQPRRAGLRDRKDLASSRTADDLAKYKLEIRDSKIRLLEDAFRKVRRDRREAVEYSKDISAELEQSHEQRRWGEMVISRLEGEIIGLKAQIDEKPEAAAQLEQQVQTALGERDEAVTKVDQLQKDYQGLSDLFEAHVRHEQEGARLRERMQAFQHRRKRVPGPEGEDGVSKRHRHA